MYVEAWSCPGRGAAQRNKWAGPLFWQKQQATSSNLMCLEIYVFVQVCLCVCATYFQA